MRRIFFGSAVRTTATAAVFSIVLGGMFYGGYVLGTSHPGTLLVKGITNIGDPDATADFSVFWEARNKLREHHVDGEKLTDPETLYGAINGMTAALRDPNTVYFRADNGESKAFEENIRGEFGGIGAEIGIRNNQLVVVAPLKNSPAERAGVRSGDHIISVDKKSTDGLDVNEAVKLIRGPIGTAVVLTMFRDGWIKTRDISIVRDQIVVPNVDWNMVEGAIAHVKLHTFNQNAVDAFSKAAAELTEKGARAMVLDLRNNPGGFLDSAVNLAGFFLEQGTVVAVERFRSGEEQTYRASGNEMFKSLPVVVLINQGSASASEILAGALRVDRGVKLVGEKSFGKGTVQELQELHDGSQLKITIANWLLPDGQLIEKNGLDPDVVVEFTEKDVEAKKDPQLERALSLLREALAPAVAE